MPFMGSAGSCRSFGPKVKICGVSDRASLKEVARLGVDAVGFIFYDGSPRAVVGAQVKAWIEDMPPFVHAVGVFVDEKASQVKKVAQLCGLSYIQLHGQETPEYCAALPKNRLIKAFRVKNGFGPDKIAPYVPHVGGILLDSAASGEGFDWRVACAIREAFPDMPLILAGGLNVENVEEAIRVVHPYAVDVSSSVETTPGVKDPAKVQELLHRIASIPSPVH